MKFWLGLFTWSDAVLLKELCWGKAMVAYKKPQERKKLKGLEKREMRSSLLIVDLNEGKF